MIAFLSERQNFFRVFYSVNSKNVYINMLKSKTNSVIQSLEIQSGILLPIKVQEWNWIQVCHSLFGIGHGFILRHSLSVLKMANHHLQASVNPYSSQCQEGNHFSTRFPHQFHKRALTSRASCMEPSLISSVQGNRVLTSIGKWGKGS